MSRSFIKLNDHLQFCLLQHPISQCQSQPRCMWAVHDCSTCTGCIKGGTYVTWRWAYIETCVHQQDSCCAHSVVLQELENLGTDGLRVCVGCKVGWCFQPDIPVQHDHMLSVHLATNSTNLAVWHNQCVGLHHEFQMHRGRQAQEKRLFNDCSNVTWGNEHRRFYNRACATACSTMQIVDAFEAD